MRVTAIVFAVALSIAGSASAQEWEQYVSTQDGFKIDFPGQPKIADDDAGSPSTATCCRRASTASTRGRSTTR